MTVKRHYFFHDCSNDIISEITNYISNYNKKEIYVGIAKDAEIENH